MQERTGIRVSQQLTQRVHHRTLTTQLFKTTKERALILTGKRFILPIIKSYLILEQGFTCHRQGDGSGLIDTMIHKNIVSNNKDSGIIIYTTGDCNPIISENVITNNSNNRINALAGGIHCEYETLGGLS